jgi:hypothetical protein
MNTDGTAGEFRFIEQRGDQAGIESLVLPRIPLPRIPTMEIWWILLLIWTFHAQGFSQAGGNLPGFTKSAQQPGEAGPHGAALAEIPIQLERNKIIVPVCAGGTSLRLILDSGQAFDGILIFDRDKIDTTVFNGLRAGTIGGAGAGSGSPALVAESASFTVGGHPFRNQRVIILTGDGFKGFPTDGVIGYSLLGHYAVEIDYDRSLMILYESDTFAVKPGWESLPIYFKNNRIPWIDITIATEDEALTRISTYIDSASSEALELLSRTVNKFRLPARTKEINLGRGLSGDINGQIGTISRMRIGTRQLANVAVAIAPAAVRSRQDNADGIIGNNALRRFNVVFDYAHNMLHIRPNSHYSEPFITAR